MVMMFVVFDIDWQDFITTHSYLSPGAPYSQKIWHQVDTEASE